MSYLVFDLETTTHTEHKRKASPFASENWVVAAGYARQHGTPFGNYFQNPEGFRHHIIPLNGIKILVGFNIKFDLLYIWDKREVKQFFKDGGRIWDCQYAEYLLEGQQQHAQMCSLDSIVGKYGGTLKIDKVKDLWDQGINTPDIPEDLLMDYLLGNKSIGVDGDIRNTELVFLGQLNAAAKLGAPFINMIKNRMDGLLATTEMEHNGLVIDSAQGEEDRIDLLNRLTQLTEELDYCLPDMPAELEFNWNSIYHKSALIFGGDISYKKWEQHTDETGTPLFCQTVERWPLFGGHPVDPQECREQEDGLYRWKDTYVQDRFKSGKRAGEAKTKNVQVADRSRPKGSQTVKQFDIDGLTTPKPEWKSSVTTGMGSPIYSTSGEVIKYLAQTEDSDFFQTLAEKVKISKDLGTYYWIEDKHERRKGMLTLLGEDDRIHHKLNHTNTVTTRLSSSDPNMQNIPRGDKSRVKRMFVSRFGADGCMVEIDYSQLEVIVQAVLSKDKQLSQDIRNGTDFHIKRLSAATGQPYETLKALHLNDDPHVCAERTRIKGFTFQRAYGAGAESISASTGMSVDKVRELISAEDRLYPRVKSFNDAVMKVVQTNKRYANKHIKIDGQLFSINLGQWISPTGTRYSFEEREAPHFLQEKGIYKSFSPTETKNYPVQGFGGEIMQTMLGCLYRWFIINDNFNSKAFLVNTVHDCVWIDCHKSMLKTVVPASKQILEAVPSKFGKDFGMKIEVPFKVEAETGPNMLELEHWH